MSTKAKRSNPTGDPGSQEIKRQVVVPEVGSSYTIKQLWEGRSPTDRLIWLTEPPKMETDDTAIPDSSQYAITLLHRNAQRLGTHILDTIIMRGAEIRTFLEDTIPNTASFYSEDEHGIAMRTPFRPLFWNMDRIEAAAKHSPNENLRKTTKLLLEVLQAEFQELLSKREELLALCEMNYDTLWTIYRPGMTCLTSYEGETIAVKVSAIEHGRNALGQRYYRIRYQFLSWDGDALGWEDTYTDIMEYNGRRKITEVDVYPVEFHGDQNIVDQLIERGRHFVGIAAREPYMMSFNGQVLDRETSPMWWQGEQRKKMYERVVLDARAYSHYFRRLTVVKWMTREDMKTTLISEKADQADFMFCRPEIFCFALQRKRWIRVWITDLQEVLFNDSAYSSLVLPNDSKDLLLAFAEAQMDGSDGFDDVIAGKGQGILMLLAGPPGTGKTLTAEAMAEHMKRPLYSVSAGELGASPGGMENELDKVLELSTRWNAFLLLDEADVFLEKRTDNDLRRNSVVSVFLRKLEYYRGIMFLTTNRIGSFDEAFRSRIHVAIRYPDLDETARRSIWENFLRKAQGIYPYGVKVGATEIDQLAMKQVNGREIRNIVKSAQLLASRSKSPLVKKHLDIIWKVEHEDSAWQNIDDF